MEQEQEPKLYTVKEAAKLLRVTPYGLYAWINQGKFACYRIGERRRNIRISQTHINEYLNKGAEK